MIKRIIIFFILVLSVLACKNETQFSPAQLNKATSAEIDLLGNRYLELGRFSGAVLVAKGDSINYSNNFGLSDYKNQKTFSDTTAFKIGEVSELITAEIIRKMAQEGKLNLSDPVSDYLHEIKADYTIEDLLNHNTGLPSIQAIKEQYPELPYSTTGYANLAYEAPQTSGNSELNYNLLGLLIEYISGSSYEENVQDYSLDLGLKNTFFEKKDNETAVGYLYHNYRNRGLELQKSPVFNSETAFSSTGLKSTAKDLLKIIKSAPDREIDVIGYTENDGFSYSVQKIPGSNTTIIVLSNRRHPVAGEISSNISDILQGKEPRLPLPRKPFDIDKKLLQEYSGAYALNENMDLKVLHENDSLFVMMGPNKIGLIPQSQNQFYMAERDASLRFLRDSTNQVSEVELLDGFLEGNRIKRSKG